MRQYVVDELRPQEVERIRRYVEDTCEPAGIGGIYWLRMPEDLLSPTQYEHKPCQPHCSAIEIGDRYIKFEMLVRSRMKIRCQCVQMATLQQRNFILAFADKMLDELAIKV